MSPFLWDKAIDPSRHIVPSGATPKNFLIAVAPASASHPSGQGEHWNGNKPRCPTEFAKVQFFSTQRIIFILTEFLFICFAIIAFICNYCFEPVPHDSRWCMLPHDSIVVSVDSTGFTHAFVSSSHTRTSSVEPLIQPLVFGDQSNERASPPCGSLHILNLRAFRVSMPPTTSGFHTCFHMHPSTPVLPATRMA